MQAVKKRPWKEVTRQRVFKRRTGCWYTLEEVEKKILEMRRRGFNNTKIARVMNLGYTFVRGISIRNGFTHMGCDYDVQESAFRSYSGRINSNQVRILNCLCVAACPMATSHMRAVLGNSLVRGKETMGGLVKCGLAVRLGRLGKKGEFVYAATVEAVRLFGEATNG